MSGLTERELTQLPPLLAKVLAARPTSPPHSDRLEDAACDWSATARLTCRATGVAASAAAESGCDPRPQRPALCRAARVDVLVVLTHDDDVRDRALGPAPDDVDLGGIAALDDRRCRTVRSTSSHR